MKVVCIFPDVKRVERLWRREGLKVPSKQPKRGRLWLNDGSCVRLRAERANHVWSYDFVHHRTHDGRAFRTLNVLDEYTRESLAIRVRRKLSSVDVIDVLTDLFILRGSPAFVRSDNGPEFVAEAVRRWIAAVGAQTAFIEPGSPWENGYIESFNARLRDRNGLRVSLNSIGEEKRAARSGCRLSSIKFCRVIGPNRPAEEFRRPVRAVYPRL